MFFIKSLAGADKKLYKNIETILKPNQYILII